MFAIENLQYIREMGGSNFDEDRYCIIVLPGATWWVICSIGAAWLLFLLYGGRQSQRGIPHHGKLFQSSMGFSSSTKTVITNANRCFCQHDLWLHRHHLKLLLIRQTR